MRSPVEYLAYPPFIFHCSFLEFLTNNCTQWQRIRGKAAVLEWILMEHQTSLSRHFQMLQIYSSVNVCLFAFHLFQLFIARDSMLIRIRPGAWDNAFSLDGSYQTANFPTSDSTSYHRLSKPDGIWFKVLHKQPFCPHWLGHKGFMGISSIFAMPSYQIAKVMFTYDED